MGKRNKTKQKKLQIKILQTGTRKNLIYSKQKQLQLYNDRDSASLHQAH